jgi:hypothetical protein
MQENASQQAGAVQPDATIYAGTLPDTGMPLFTVASDVFMTVDFEDAGRYLAGMNKAMANGHDDWRMPTKGELGVLFKHYAQIGGFIASDESSYQHYWSSSPPEIGEGFNVYARRLSDLEEAPNFSKRNFAVLRPVR